MLSHCAAYHTTDYPGAYFSPRLAELDFHWGEDSQALSLMSAQSECTATSRPVSDSAKTIRVSAVMNCVCFGILPYKYEDAVTQPGFRPYYGMNWTVRTGDHHPRSTAPRLRVSRTVIGSEYRSLRRPATTTVPSVAELSPHDFYSPAGSERRALLQHPTRQGWRRSHNAPRLF